MKCFAQFILQSSTGIQHEKKNEINFFFLGKNKLSKGQQKMVTDTRVSQKFHSILVTRGTIWQLEMVLLRVWRWWNDTGLWDAELAWYSPTTTWPICLNGLELRLGFYGFMPTWLLRFLQPVQKFSNLLVIALWSTVPSSFAQQMFFIVSTMLWLSSNS